MMQASARPELAQLDLLEMLALDVTEFKRRFADTPLARVKLRGLRRNACVALGNVGSDTCRPALQAAAAAPDSLVADHARWALDQISARLR
jgi:epoxyqueuosine reductase